jgi:hypothetical protein
MGRGEIDASAIDQCWRSSCHHPELAEQVKVIDASPPPSSLWSGLALLEGLKADLRAPFWRSAGPFSPGVDRPDPAFRGVDDSMHDDIREMIRVCEQAGF